MSKIITGPEVEASRMRIRAMDVIGQIMGYEPYNGNSETRKDQLSPPNISVFKDIDPVLIFSRQDKDWFVFSDTTPQVIWPFQLSTVKKGEDKDWFDIFLCNFTPILPKQARGFARIFSPWMGIVNIAVADKFHKKQMVTAKSVVSFVGGRWVGAESRTIWEGPKGSEFPQRNMFADPELMRSISLMNGMALRHRYEWAVSLGFENCPSVRFSTDPTGIKELFRLRDVPDGRDKRSALMNWVSDHWRQDRKDSDVETYVRKHLRGTTKFNWRGFEAKLMPSAFDMDKVDEIKQARELMKLSGADKRSAI